MQLRSRRRRRAPIRLAISVVLPRIRRRWIGALLEPAEQTQHPDDADDQAALDAATAAKEAVDKAAENAANGGTSASAGEPTDSVTVSAVAFSGLQAQVQNLSARNEALEQAATDKRRDGIIATALSEGRLTPAEVQPWREALDQSEASTVTLLASRTPVFSTVERGHASSLSTAGEAHAKALQAEEDRAFGIG